MIRFSNQRGTASMGIAGVMLGFGVLYFICYFILNWIYDTKEDRKNPKHKEVEVLKTISKEEVMKRGVGQHVFVCSGFLFRTCKGKDLYKDTVEMDS